MKNQFQAERKSRNTSNLSAFRVLSDKVCGRGNVDSCLLCGADVPEGRQICPACQQVLNDKPIKEGQR